MSIMQRIRVIWPLVRWLWIVLSITKRDRMVRASIHTNKGRTIMGRNVLITGNKIEVQHT